ncbi:unnamed protein product [Callosobruchus maculatus]|uniref:Uncharacterized protein n=1 Tax=Callosobruchus maculatus TaxID=64391 RepID=A0A653DCI0_CALMS|nr:unnamed protein product [Callosobruchus maculatus]
MKIKAEMQNLEPKDQLMQRRSTILREKQIAEEKLQQLRDDVERRQKELQRLRDEEERRQKKLQRLRDEYERHQKKSQQLDASVQYFARKVAKLESLKAKVRKLEELIPMVESIRDDWLSQEKHSI